MEVRRCGKGKTGAGGVRQQRAELSAGTDDSARLPRIGSRACHVTCICHRAFGTQPSASLDGPLECVTLLFFLHHPRILGGSTKREGLRRCNGHTTHVRPHYQSFRNSKNRQMIIHFVWIRSIL